MTYRLVIRRNAKKEMRDLPDRTRSRVASRILELGKEPRGRGTKKLEQTSMYRVRVSDYRILYEVDDVERFVTIEAILHRKDAYR